MRNISCAADLTDEEIVRAMQGPKPSPGAFLHDPLEAPLAIATGAQIVPTEEGFFDKIRRRYEVILDQGKK